jgi:hypothetical protein
MFFTIPREFYKMKISINYLDEALVFTFRPCEATFWYIEKITEANRLSFKNNLTTKLKFVYMNVTTKVLKSWFVSIKIQFIKQSAFLEMQRQLRMQDLLKLLKHV